MKKLLLFLCLLASPVYAQQEVDAALIYLGQAGTTCVMATGAGAPTGGTGCQFYTNVTNSDLWTRSGSTWTKISTGGTVTSVAMTVPSFLIVAGSPITTSGTLAVTLATQSANTALRGPTSGSAAAPTFRADVNADIASAGVGLTKTDDTNVTATLGGSPTTALVNAASITLGWTGQLSLARGGTNANLVAANGAIPYSTTTAIALLAAGSSGQMLRSGGAGAPAWSTSTWPSTATTCQVMYATGTNAWGGSANLCFSGTQLGIGGTATGSFNLHNYGTTLLNGAVSLGNGAGTGGELRFFTDTVNQWRTYMNTADTTFYLRDMVNSAYGFTVTAGATPLFNVVALKNTGVSTFNGAVVLGNGAGTGADLRFYSDTTDTWHAYMNSGDSTFYLRDMVHSVSGITVTAAATPIVQVPRLGIGGSPAGSFGLHNYGTALINGALSLGNGAGTGGELRFFTDTTDTWRLYMNTADDTIYMRDIVHSAYGFYVTAGVAPTFNVGYVLNVGTAANIGGLLSANGGATVPAGEVLETDYTSGWTGSGYTLNYDATYVSQSFLELDRLSVRGIFDVYELLVHQIRATNGSIFVTNTGKAKEATDLAPPGAQYYLIETETEHGFDVGDLIRAQRFTGTGVYQSDLVVYQVDDDHNFRAELRATYTPPAAGMDFVRLGNTSDVDRQGSIYMTADDAGAPFIRVLDGVNSFAAWGTASKTRMQTGNLNGSYGYATDVYGIAAGDSAATNFTLDATNGFRIRYGTSNRLTADTSGNLSLIGAITANTGYIGGTSGWIIAANTLKDVAGVVGLSNVVTGGNDIRFWAGDATPASAEFIVYENGDVFASNLTATGNITANAGAIGGFVIGSTYLRDAADSFGLTSAVTGGNDCRFWAGDARTNCATAPFHIFEDGTGKVGGFDFGTTYVRDVNDSFGMVGNVSGGNDCRFWAGDNMTDCAIAPFHVFEDGTGLMGGFAFGGSKLSSGTDADYVALISDGTNAIQVGDSTFADAKFSVTAAGSTKVTILSVLGAATIGTGGSLATGASSFSSGTGCWMAYNSGTPQFRCGTTSVNQFAWNGSTLTLTSGPLTINSTGILLGVTPSGTCIDGCINSGSSSYRFESSGNTSQGGMSSVYATSPFDISNVFVQAGGGGAQQILYLQSGVSSPAAAIEMIDHDTTSGSPAAVTHVYAGNFAVGGSQLNPGTASIYMTAAGAVKFGAFGAGTATFDALGNISSVSDELKKVIVGPFVAGLNAVLGLKPIVYRYSEESGLDTENTYAQFSAQNVLGYVPEAVGVDLNGGYSFNVITVVAAQNNAIRELVDEIDELRAALSLRKKDRVPVLQDSSRVVSSTKALIGAVRASTSRLSPDKQRAIVAAIGQDTTPEEAYRRAQALTFARCEALKKDVPSLPCRTK